MPQNVLVVPGFTASELISPVPIPGRKPVLVWFDPITLAQTGPGILQLAADGLSPGPLVPSWAHLSLRGLSKFAPYYDLTDWLSRNQYPYVLWTYDWRLDAQALANRLGLYLSTKYDSAPFTVIAHSYGGLIARLAYPVYQATSKKGNWKSTVYVACPHWGSYEAIRAFLGAQQYYSLMRSFFTLVGALAKLGLAEGVLSPAKTGSVQDRLLATVASWPGLASLMPDLTGGAPVPDPFLPAFYQALTYAPLNPNVTQPILTDAATIRAALNGTLTQPRPVEKNVIATGYSTVYQTLGGVAANRDDYWVYTPQGDGVIPVSRQQLPGSQQAQITSPHYLAADNSTFLSLLPDLLDITSQIASPAPQPPPPVPPLTPPPFRTLVELIAVGPPSSTQTRNDP
jgi:pimeloyl-ACP methyl ester carboxylesterase